eukprot:TRINITY_DN8099_c0_g1_i1.p1 TRINITY_DN8099_c0_g1~~TRINITY_DN8099_c0_g1_i1.p1  ORF type:complete len:2224 (+),score=235.34 TRINITY_DN8099_c0_g1_i1:482-6673(+)
MAAADKCRSHIEGLKRLTWTSTESADFEVVCAVLTLAEISSCHIAGRQVASDSIHFLLSPRVRQKCKRPDLSHAIAVIVQSFPPHAPPDDRLVDNMLEYSLSSSSVKQGSAGFATALLTAVLAPFLVSRGSQPSDDVFATCAKALRVAPSPTERSMWILAMARASVTARRSPLFQLRKYGTPELGSKFPQDGQNSTVVSEKAFDDSDPANWVSNNIFEDSLLQIARETHLDQGDVESSIAVAAVLRMWSQALPESIPILIPNTMAKLMPDLHDVKAVSTLVDAIWLGLLKNLKPSLSTTVFKGLLPALESDGLEFAATLHLCAVLIATHGRQALHESGVSTDYRDSTKMILSSIHNALESKSSAIRLSAVRLMDAVVRALPRTCFQLLTTILQNLRIADLALATKNASVGNRSNIDVGFYEAELSSLLGNAAALSVLTERITLGECSVPAALKHQVIVDSLSLLRAHLADQGGNAFDAVHCIRRRAGWGLIAALARGKQNELFEGENLTELMGLWREELGYASAKLSTHNNAGFFGHQTNTTIPDASELLAAASFEHMVRSSCTRSAALRALVDAVQNIPSPRLELCTDAVGSACAARISALLTSVNMTANSGGSSSASGLVSLSLETESAGEAIAAKKRMAVQLVRTLTAECIQLMQCLAVVPPKGDAGELCFLISVSLAEEAQKLMGEDPSNQGPIHSGGGSFSHTAKDVEGITMSNRRLSLYHLSSHLSTLLSFEGIKRTRPERIKSDTNSHSAIDHCEIGWLFDQEGISSSFPEQVLMHSARAVAGIVAEDLMTSGSLIESMSSIAFSPPMSASICLELTKRLSRSDLAEINRALAVLQILARKSLTVNSGSQMSINSQSKTGKIYTPGRGGDGNCCEQRDLPGYELQVITQSGRWLGWARAFSDEGHIARVPYHNFHTRALGIMYATRTISAEAHRELSITGGPALWVGLMRRVISAVKNNVGGSSATQSVILSNAIAALGALLEVVPEPSSGVRGDGVSPRRKRPDECDGLDEVSEQAINIIAEAIESGKSEVQAAAALALSSCSHRVASASERLLGALLRAWSQDRGDFPALGHFGRCAYEVDIWLSCFGHLWQDMGVREVGNRARFFTQDSRGIGGASSSFVTAASAVVSSCRLHWWPLSESSHFSVKEMSTELLEWNGETSRRARAAGIHGMTSLWAAKIDFTQSEFVSTSLSHSESSGVTYTDGKEVEKPILPVESFSLKDQSRLSSPVGPFLDEILYEALAPLQDSDDSIELQDSATKAVLEVIKGAGAVEICANLPRLPESLFATVNCGIGDAEKAIMKLVKADAAKRPRYWFGLCRAICLGGERLNFGHKKTVWDVSLSTKRFTVKVASDALDVSLAACNCSISKGKSVKGFGSHTCAYGFVRKVFDFVHQICGRHCIDFGICTEGCRLLQKITVRTGHWLSSWKADVDLFPEFKDMWETCSSLVEKLLTDKAPDCLVQAASSAMTEKLLLSLRRKNVSESSLEAAIIFLDNMVEWNSKNGLLFADQGEVIGTNAALGFTAKYGMLVSALGAVEHKSSSPHTTTTALNPLVQQLLFACCGDFVSALTGEGLRMLAKDGGSITSPSVSEKMLMNSMRLHIAPIVLGAVSSSCINYREIKTDMARVWENIRSPGVKMGLECSKHMPVALATMVWLIKHDQGESIKLNTLAAFSTQYRETLTCLLKSGMASDELGSEALSSFAEWNQTEFLKFAEQLSTREDLEADAISLMIDFVLSILQLAVDDDFSIFKETETNSVNRALLLLRGFGDKLAGIGNQKVSLIHGKILDVILHATAAESEVVATVFSSKLIQSAFYNLMSKCVSRSDTLPLTVDFCYQHAKCLISYGTDNQSLAHVEMGVTMVIALERISEEVSLSDVVSVLVADCSFFSDGQKEQTLLGISLSCYNIEVFLTRLFSEAASEARSDIIDTILLLLEQLQRMALSDEQFEIPIAIRCALNAILAEGKRSSEINKSGMILYSILLPLLVRALPVDYEENKSFSDSSLKCAKFFVELVEEEQDTLDTLVSYLKPEERERAIEFMTQWEASNGGAGN